MQQETNGTRNKRSKEQMIQGKKWSKEQMETGSNGARNKWGKDKMEQGINGAMIK